LAHEISPSFHLKKKNPTFLERENRKETRIKRVYTKKLKRNLVGEVRKSEGAESDNK
jgi:hypothetical protein